MLIELSEQSSKVPQFLYVVVIPSTTHYICTAELFLRWTLLRVYSHK